MIITKTPFRISFVGGGSDLEDFYSSHGGAVLSVTINKYMYISSHHFFDSEKVRIKYSKTETVTSIDKIEHPIVREILKKFEIRGALEISSNADIPAGTGLGSSSAFTVGMLHNLYVRACQYVSKHKIAEEACDIEINKLREPIGKQDQYASSFGGLNIFTFDKSGTVAVEPVHLNVNVYKKLRDNLLLFYIGRKRKASTILNEQRANMQDSNKVEIVKEMVKLVWQSRDALYSNELDHFGQILHKNWILKRELASKICDNEIDRIYDLALKNGAIGGKLLGAGGGGFMLLYCPITRQNELRNALAYLKELEFKFENNGSTLLYAGDEYV